MAGENHKDDPSPDNREDNNSVIAYLRKMPDTHKVIDAKILQSSDHEYQSVSLVLSIVSMGSGTN
jgi:hypothetical protein